MAESDELTFDNATAQMEQLVKFSAELHDNLQKTASLKFDSLSKSGAIGSTDDIKAQNKAKQEAIGLDGKLTEVKKQQIAQQQILNALSKAERDNIKASNSAYSALSQEYGQALQKAKDLAVQYGVGSKEAGEWTKKATDLNNKLKAVDASLGNHQRNVGNYANSVRDLGMKISGLSGIMSILGRVVGIDAEQVRALHEIHSTMREGMRDMHHLQMEGIAVQREGIAVTEAETAVNEELGASWTAALGPIGLIIIGIAALAAGIGIYVAESNKAKEEEKERSKAMDGTIIVDKELRKEYNEHLLAIRKLANAYEVLNGTMTQYDANLSNLVQQTKVELSDLENETTDKLQKVNGFWNGLKNVFLDVITASQPGMHQISEAMKIGAEAAAKAKAIIQKSTDESNVKDLEETKRFGEEKAGLEKEIAEKRAAMIKDETARERRELDIKQAEEIRKINEGDLSPEHQAILINEIKEKYALEWAEFEDKMRQKELEEEQEYNNRVLDIFKKRLEAQKAAFDAETKKREGNFTTAAGIDVTNAGLSVKEAEGRGAGATEIANLKNQLAEAKREQASLALSGDNSLSPENRSAKAVIIQREYNDEIVANNREALKKQYDDALKAEKDKEDLLKKYHEAELKAQQDSLHALEQILDSQNQMQQQGLKTQTDMIQNEAQVQATLAAQGRKNTLAQTMAAENKAAEDALKLQRQQQKQKEAIALAELFITAEASFIKGGDSPTKAAVEAMGAVLLAKGISAGLAGAFFEGTPDTGGPGRLDSKGGMLAVLHPHEAVIPKARNEEYPGLAKAWITGKLDTYLATISMPQIQNVDMKEVKKELSVIKEVLIKQTWAVAYNLEGRAIVEEHSGDGKKMRIIESPLTIRIR